MFRCKIINLFFIIFPIKVWQDFLIGHHIQKCPACQSHLASLEETKPFLVQESEIENLESLWPAIKSGLSEGKRKERLFFRPRLKWAAGVAGLLIAILAGIWLYSVFSPEKISPKQPLINRFQINYIRVEKKPARAFLYSLPESKMVIVWAEKNI